MFRRTIPIGVEHGTVAVLGRDRQPHEVTTFRKDVSTDGRHAVVAFGVSLDEDLARRDFTINAIGYHPLRHEWRDPYDGKGDLERKLVRAVGDPNQRFREDHLRILRALRFAARFGFEIAEPTWSAAKAQVDGLRQLSAERVREEWFRGLETAARRSELVELWSDVGALAVWLPELEEEGRRGSITVIDAFQPPDPVLITAYLSAEPAGTLERLKCSNAEIERAGRIDEHRGRLPNPEEPVSIRRWVAALGPAVDDLVAIARAEGQGARLAEAVRAVRASGVPLSVGDLAIGGHHLLEAGVPEGPRVGEILRALLERVLEDPDLNTRDRLLELAGRDRDRLLVSRLPSHERRGRRGK